ncbi:hypothetical protein PVAND_014464 [Polypedilum vanderplanki]|uniref:tRNA:m(4)X modification enzyme TRM13 n=1 Tax=Polypedilum vanderplanki TaxID=319348 RepID=A0A9J6B9G8_POLVA|nr:hypothetical protein PVAND_014464 [Polypedilum vanderplanki]
MEHLLKSPKRMRIEAEKQQKITQKIENQANQPHCHFWVKRKSRYCKMTIKPNHKFCGEHEPPIEQEPLDESRIFCPLDPSHSVFKFKLEKHLKVCNARKKEVSLAYVKKNLNIGLVDNGEDENFKLRDLPDDEIYRVIKIVNELFERHVEGKIATEIKSHKIFDDEMRIESYGDEKIRHLSQASSILGILESRELLKEKTCFIDLGAGRGHLSYWLSKLIVDEKIEDSKVLVVDRASHRHKRDNLFKEIGVVERIRVDLADLDLKELPFNKCNSIVGVSKHLCGRATDFALRCILNGNNGPIISKGFLICVCCHHQTTFDSFLGREWLISHGIDRKTFNVIIRMVSWCVCGDGRRREDRKNEILNNEKMKEREVVGWRCKRLLDYARVKVMSDAGYDTGLSYYVDKSHTLENICIVGNLKIDEIKNEI